MSKQKQAPLAAKPSAELTEADDALRWIENGIAVLYALCRRDSTDEQLTRALYFTAEGMSDQVERAQKALGLRSNT